MRSATDRAFLRELKQLPSRPRFAAGGPRPRSLPSRPEIAERMMVARIIREARERTGMPRQDVAGLVGVSTAMLGRWERAEEALPVARRAQFAGLYGFDLSLIANLDAEGIALTPDERALLAAFRHLPEDARRALLELARP